MEFKELKELIERDFGYGQETRDKAANDLIFYYITQWDDDLLKTSPLEYRGQFDVVRKAGRQILAKVNSSPIQIDFHPKDPQRNDDAEVLDGLYRIDDKSNTSIEAYDNAKQEAIVCGFGAWLMSTKYESNSIGDNYQVVERKPIYEAVNRVIFDSNAKLKDKADAEHVSLIHTYSVDGYKKMKAEFTGVDPDDVQIDSSMSPNRDTEFCWMSGSGDVVYVVESFFIEKVKDRVIFIESPLQYQMALLSSQVADVLDDMIDEGYKVLGDRDIERPQVRRYLLDGVEIIDNSIVPGKSLPVVPMYGERGYVHDEEYYEGIVRLAKDPQRLRNFQLSYLASIVSKSPRQKPIYASEQIKGHEYMYEESGADDNYPYRLQNLVSDDGQELPRGPLGMTPQAEMPQALIASIQLSREAIEDVANSALPQNIADPDLSGKAVSQLQKQVDMQTSIYQENWKHAKRRDAMVYAGITSQIYDTPRPAVLEMSDGRKKDVNMMESIIDPKTGNPVVLNDISNMEFDVYADVGMYYSSQKEQTRQEIKELIAMAPQGSAERNLLLLMYYTMLDGTDVSDLKKYANNQLILQGFREPETDEEVQMLQKAQQAKANQQNPEAVALLSEGKARILEGQATYQEAMNDKYKLTIDKQKADNESAKIQIQAAQAGVNMNNVRADTTNKRLDAQEKISLRYSR